MRVQSQTQIIVSNKDRAKPSKVVGLRKMKVIRALIQYSLYTSNHLCLNSWKTATTILENTASAFFKPKGITVYAKEPHSVCCKCSFCSIFLLLQFSSLESVCKRICFPSSHVFEHLIGKWCRESIVYACWLHFNVSSLHNSLSLLSSCSAPP